MIALALICLAVLGYLAWDRGCQCEKCGFHVNERRMERERAKEREHDAEHKGFAFRDHDPDRFACNDDNCNRNPKPRS